MFTDLRRYVSETTVTLNGAAVSVTLPSVPAGTLVIEIAASGGNVYYAINGTASDSSAGFVSQGRVRTIPPLSNLKSLSVYGASGAHAHILFYAL